MTTKILTLVVIVACTLIPIHTITIVPNNISQFITIKLTNDSRGFDKIINNEWKLRTSTSNPLYDW